jgi:oligoendopeptidase F
MTMTDRNDRAFLPSGGAGSPGASLLHEAVVRYEQIEDLLGRLIVLCRARLCRRHHRSGAGEVLRRHRRRRSPRRRRTSCSSPSSSTGIDDALLDQAISRDPPLARYRPWLEDIRKDKPFQLDDRTEKLFHEKSMTGRAAWNRLFDETISSCASRSTARS